MEPQVEPKHYDTNYDSKRRFVSYWHQIREVLRVQPSSVLEVGVGNGFVSNYLRGKGVGLTTVDHDERLKPDIVADITTLPFPDSSFDVVTAYEVLEHVPYEKALEALRELYRVSCLYVILSLPDATRSARLELPIPGFGKFQKLLIIPHLWARKHECTKSGHHWEIGKRGFSLRRIKGDIEKSGFRVKKTYRVFENPRHRFFVLEKSKL